MSIATAPPVNGKAIDKPQREWWTTALARARATWIQIPILLAAAGLLIGSIFLPYWNIVLRAPQTVCAKTSCPNVVVPNGKSADGGAMGGPA